jgi:hypothetical protein
MMPGSRVLGVVNADGRVEFLKQEVIVDKRFIEVAEEGRNPRKRFRFVNTCVEKGCTQWESGKCGVAEATVEAELPMADTLPECGIRQSCRWFAQRGEVACRMCPEVITELFAEDPSAG